jgi:beta-glucosidase/6-phospho-beta-glucosidase/beta-galactosidase
MTTDARRNLRTRSNPPTLEVVAARAGVSRATAGRVLSGATNVSEHAREAVLRDILLRVRRDWPGLPVIVTENGAAFDDVAVDGAVHDVRRTAYLREHLGAVASAIATGADVRGYLVWSLMDNFEWAWGFDKRFGLIHIDYRTLQRTVKDSGLWYRDQIASLRGQNA